MQKFNPCGEVRRDHQALALNVDGWTLGRLVVAAGDVSKLLKGAEVEVSFLQQREDGEVFVGYAGRARPSRSGKAFCFYVEGHMATVPRRALEAVVSGSRPAARVSSPAPVIDADQEQAKPIDHDLVRSFV
ncbi:MAG: hypothetical protein GX837_06705 [Methanomicrobiales archaeon]|jgi:hypothetical protein|nr:hypothetical protein [Methanomicrobiales archaeon]